MQVCLVAAAVAVGGGVAAAEVACMGSGVIHRILAVAADQSLHVAAAAAAAEGGTGAAGMVVPGFAVLGRWPFSVKELLTDPSSEQEDA